MKADSKSEYVNLSQQLMVEAELIMNKAMKAEKRRKILTYLNLYHPTQLPSGKTLEKAYALACQRANASQESEITKTHYELAVAKKIRAHTRIAFKESFWIGGVNIDLFTDSIKGEPSQLGRFRSKGLAIEIDGSIHNNSEIKMRKDNAKYETLHRLGIFLLVFENFDLYEKKVNDIISQIKSCPRTDTRTRRRLRRNIYLETILYHFSDSQFYELFDLKRRGGF